MGAGEAALVVRPVPLQTVIAASSFESPNAIAPLGKDNLTAAEVAQLIGLSVHTLSYWRQSGQGPKAIKAGTRIGERKSNTGSLE
jgi:hypothetical protein